MRFLLSFLVFALGLASLADPSGPIRPIYIDSSDPFVVFQIKDSSWFAICPQMQVSDDCDYHRFEDDTVMPQILSEYEALDNRELLKLVTQVRSLLPVNDIKAATDNIVCDCQDNKQSFTLVRNASSSTVEKIVLRGQLGNDNTPLGGIVIDQDGNDRGRTFSLLMQLISYLSDRKSEITLSSTLFSELLNEKGLALKNDRGRVDQKVVEVNQLEYRQTRYGDSYDRTYAIGVEDRSGSPRILAQLQNGWHKTLTNLDLADYITYDNHPLEETQTNIYAQTGVAKEFSQTSTGKTWNCYLRSRIEVGLSTNDQEDIYGDYEVQTGLRSSKMYTRDIAKWDISLRSYGRKSSGYGTESAVGVQASYAFEWDRDVIIPSIKITHINFYEDRHYALNEPEDEPYVEFDIQWIPGRK
ncbi:MAG: hypothetical protein CL675_01690 [Bdellovibrionaceae bacterium]|nr:hypothetical protein [Pseudobdellovibrionaceae bacterium]